MNTRIGALPFVAESRAHYARALLARGRAEDATRASAQSERAREIARALGLRTPRSGAEHGPAGDDALLSAREREVARLVADGLSNVEIAARLFISKRTVETHMDNIRHKLGFTTRAAIISWVMRRS